MKSNYKKLGQFIREVSIKNKELKVDLLLGVSITKQFIPSIANTIGTDMSIYKIVKQKQFAYGPVTSRNGDKISVALLNEEECIISTSYTVFEIIDTNLLDPEYLMMWFRRSEFDRYARYMSHGTVRELFGWQEMCDVELPVPSIEKQREIVREYNVVNDRIALNEQLIQKLEDTAQAIYKQWFVDFEFPISKEYAESIGKPELEGKPYKSSGGEMEASEGNVNPIPLKWSNGTLASLYKFQYGNGNTNPSNGGIFPVYGSNGIIGGYDTFNAEDSPVIGHIGANCGSLVFAFGKHYVTYNGVICNPLEGSSQYFSYVTLSLKDLQSQTRGSSQPFISYDILYEIETVLPTKNIEYKYESLALVLFEKIKSLQKEMHILKQIIDIILQKISQA